jgi:membrane protein YdbS with pleckstrin-like domain
MSEKNRPFESPFLRASLSFVVATIATNMTFIPVFAILFFEKVLPQWVLGSFIIVWASLAAFVGLKVFRWLYRYLGTL